MDDYDVVIVGAGPGGCVLAKTLEDSELKVCIIDAKPKEKIGEKICGDAIGKGHFDFLNEKINLPYPSKEVKAMIKGIKVFSPDEKTTFKVETKEGGYMIDRLLFGQHLISELKSADLMENTRVVDFHDNGVVTEKNGKQDKINGKIVVDASGVPAVLRKKIKSPYIENEVDLKDTAICYREIREYKFEDSEYCHIYLNQELTKGGYVWIFPEGEHVNIGIGAQYPMQPKKQYELFIKHFTTVQISSHEEDKKFSNSKIVSGGGGVVPTRKPIDSLTAMHGNVGFMVVGDSACQANPIHGGGIGEAMIAGYLAGVSIKNIHEKKGIKKVSLDDLWEYNFSYMRKYGAKNAGLDVFRIFLQGLSDSQIDFGMGRHLIDEKDLIKVFCGEEINLSTAEKMTRLVLGITNLDVLKKLKFTAGKMHEIKDLYQNYPDPKEFSGWRMKVKAIFDEVHEKAK